MSKPRQRREKLSSQERLDKFQFKNLRGDAPQDYLTLPIGFVNEEGVLFRHAKVRGMTAGDRKTCANSKNQRSAAHMTTAMLAQSVVAIADETGNHVLDEKKLGPPLFRSMTEADRSFLAMEIRRQTYPDKPMPMTATCENPDCKEKIDHDIDLEELEVKFIDKPVWREGAPCFEITDDEYGIQGWMKYLTGADMETISNRFGNIPERKINPVELLQRMVEAMVLEINGQEVAIEDLDVFPQEIHSILEEHVQDHRAGPDLMPWVRCPECDCEMQLRVSIVDFLLRGRQKKGSGS